MAKLTSAGLALMAQLQANEDTLIIDKMIYAYIDGLDPETEPPATEAMPDAGDIVRNAEIAQAGYVDPNTVVYSDLMDATIGDFTFNWIGLYCTEFDTLVAVTYLKPQSKHATSGQNIGNTLSKNFAINYTAIQDLTGIVIAAETWQQNFGNLFEPIGSVAIHEAAANPHPQYTRFIEDFVTLQTANGYQKLPNGIIIQWGLSNSLAQNANQTITLPIAFPNAALNLVTSPRVSTSSENGQSSSGYIVSSTQITVSNTSTVSISFEIYWVAIGY